MLLHIFVKMGLRLEGDLYFYKKDINIYGKTNRLVIDGDWFEDEMRGHSNRDILFYLKNKLIYNVRSKMAYKLGDVYDILSRFDGSDLGALKILSVLYNYLMNRNKNNLILKK